LFDDLSDRMALERHLPVNLNAAATGTSIEGYLTESPAVSIFALHMRAATRPTRPQRNGVEFLMSDYPIPDRVPQGRDEAAGFRTGSGATMSTADPGPGPGQYAAGLLAPA
jgi:hypothetical protein